MALRAAAGLTRTFGNAGVTRRCIRPMASAAGAPTAPQYWTLRYDYVPDIVERRGPYREAHLAAAGDQLRAGKLVCAGATGSPPDGALFIFKGVSQEDIEAFVKADPYVNAGLVTSHKVSPYAVVVGEP